MGPQDQLAFTGIFYMVLWGLLAFILVSINNTLVHIKRILTAWSKETGIGYKYRCSKCKKRFEGKQSECPHCGDPKTYK